MISLLGGPLEVDILFGATLEIAIVFGLIGLFGSLLGWLYDFNGAMRIYRQMKKDKKKSELT
jgi:hypothetical protein